MLELDACALLAVAGEQRGKHVRARVTSASSSGWTPGRTPLSGAGSGSASIKPFEVTIAEALKIPVAEIDAGARRAVFQNPLVGPTGHRDRVERARNTEQIFERPVHRAAAGAARSNECSINVEQNNLH